MENGSERRIPASKLFVSQLSRARETVGFSGNNLVGLQLLGVEFTRVWLQVRKPLAKRVCTFVFRALVPSPRLISIFFRSFSTLLLSLALPSDSTPCI